MRRILKLQGFERVGRELTYDAFTAQLIDLFKSEILVVLGRKSFDPFFFRCGSITAQAAKRLPREWRMMGATLTTPFLYDQPTCCSSRSITIQPCHFRPFYSKKIHASFLSRTQSWWWLELKLGHNSTYIFVAMAEIVILSGPLS